MADERRVNGGGSGVIGSGAGQEVAECGRARLKVAVGGLGKLDGFDVWQRIQHRGGVAVCVSGTGPTQDGECGNADFWCGLQTESAVIDRI